MKNLVLTAVLALSGLFTSCAVLLAESSVETNAPNPVPFRLDVTSLSTLPAPVTNTTAANHTTPVTNTTAANHTTPVTNTTAANHTTPVTNTTAANHTTPVTNTTAANRTMPAPVTNTTAANRTTPVTNTTAANHTTTMHPVTTVFPTLTPNFSLPLTGNYSVSSKNTTCIKMVIGIQLVVNIKPKNLYFSIQPRDVVTSGKCGNVASWINLNFKTGFVNFTFGKSEKEYYITEIGVALHSMNNLDNIYKGIVKNMKLFNTELRHSYKCKSKQVVAFSTDSLEILMVDTQLQAFNISGGVFSKEAECSMDYSYVLPIIFGIGLAVLIIIIIIVYLICRYKQAAGYQRI